MFEDSGGDAFHGSDGPSMDHHDAAVFSTIIDEGEVEPFRLVEVQLHGGDGLFVTSIVPDLQIELRPVERCLARCFDENSAA